MMVRASFALNCSMLAHKYAYGAIHACFRKNDGRGQGGHLRGSIFQGPSYQRPRPAPLPSRARTVRQVVGACSGWLSVLVHLYTQTIYSKILERWVIFATGPYPFSHKDTGVGRPSLLMFLAHRSGRRELATFHCLLTAPADARPSIHGPAYRMLQVQLVFVPVILFV